MGAMPLYLAIILARAKAYSRASATLHVSGTYKQIKLLIDKFIYCYIYWNFLEKFARLLLFSIRNWKGHKPVLSHQYTCTSFLEAPRPALLIPATSHK